MLHNPIFCSPSPAPHPPKNTSHARDSASAPRCQQSRVRSTTLPQEKTATLVTFRLDANSPPHFHLSPLCANKLHAAVHCYAHKNKKPLFFREHKCGIIHNHDDETAQAAKRGPHVRRARLRRVQRAFCSLCRGGKSPLTSRLPKFDHRPKLLLPQERAPPVALCMSLLCRVRSYSTTQSRSWMTHLPPIQKFNLKN